MSILVVAGLVIAGAARADPDHRIDESEDLQAQGAAYGVPGDPGKPARVVQIAMREGGGRMVFAPDRVDVRVREQIRFIVRNTGTVEHEFILSTRAENARHAAEMRRSPAMRHDPRNMMRLQPAKTGELLWRFTRGGEFDFSCLMPGHREAGMFGTVIVN
jgi:uncharacterized cupredoxin-like copper-binding protein